MKDDARIGFIGLGVMGEPICLHLSAAGGWPVTAYDLKPDPCERARAAGVAVAGSAAEAAMADLVILCLPGGEQVERLVLGDSLLDAMRPGAVLVDMSTSPPALMKQIDAVASSHGVDFADAPVARTRLAAAKGELAIMAGASPAVFARIAPVLSVIGSDVTHCGDVGAGQLAKILNNMVLFQTVAALAEALEIAEGAGMEGERLLSILSTGSADSFALRNHGMKSLAPQTYPQEAFSVRYAAKDLAYALDLAEEAGLRADGAAQVQALFDLAESAGYGDDYFPVIRRLFRSGRLVKGAD